MAREIIINFGTRNLEKAKAIAQDIARKVKDAGKAIRDVDVRKRFMAAQREAAQARKADIAGQEQRLGFERRAAALAASDPSAGRLGAITRGAQRAQAVGGAIAGLGRAFQEGDFLGGVETAGRLIPGPIGQAVQLAAVVVQIVKREVDREIDQKVAAAANRLAVQRRREEFERDLPRRFREDPVFRDQAVREALAAHERERAFMRARGLRHRGRNMGVGE